MRSPLAATLLGARLCVHGVAAVVTSAGTGGFDLPVSPDAVTVAAELGCAIEHHRPRVVTPEILRTDGADLVLTMTRQQLREVAVLEPAGVPRTFTLKELVRRAGGDGARGTAEDLSVWLGRLAAERDLRELFGDHAVDDVEDPYGRSLAVHRRVAAELDRLVRSLVIAASW